MLHLRQCFRCSGRLGCSQRWHSASPWRLWELQGVGESHRHAQETQPWRWVKCVQIATCTVATVFPQGICCSLSKLHVSLMTVTWISVERKYHPAEGCMFDLAHCRLSPNRGSKQSVTCQWWGRLCLGDDKSLPLFGLPFLEPKMPVCDLFRCADFRRWLFCYLCLFLK